MTHPMRFPSLTQPPPIVVASLAICLLGSGCGKGGGAGAGDTSKKTTIQVKGSDTMVNLAQAWAGGIQKSRNGVHYGMGKSAENQ